MRRRETRLVSGRGWYHYTEGLLHHAEKLAFFFQRDTGKAKVEQRDRYGNNSNSPGNAGERLTVD